ncbi:hypothetical protein [Streptomyces sp. NPDC026673]|uniref:hypothetical protein n=1 Tax=Streptomyces sp. NPDC026673 TaxID=3155724 RepID=UPI0033FADCD8
MPAQYGAHRAVVGHEDLVRAVAAEVATADERPSRVEQVRCRRVLDADRVADSDELTPTIKTRRSRMAEMYAGIVDALHR